MRALSPLIFCLVMLATLVRSSADDVLAVEYRAPSANAARIDQLEREIAALRSSMLDVGVAPATFHEDVPPGRGMVADCVGDACCGPTSGVYGGAALVIAKLHFKEAFETSTIDLLTGTLNLNPFEYDYEANTRAWLGYVAPNRLGVRASYAHFDQAANPTTLTSTVTTVHSAQVVTVNIPASISTMAPGQTLSISSSLNAETIELEGTLDFDVAGIHVKGAGGLRYAKLDQDSAAVVLAGMVPQQQLIWEREFEGIGPTLGAEFHRPLGCYGLSLYGSGRGSLLFGHKSLSRFVNPPSGALPPLPLARLDGADEVVPIFDLGLGVEWTHDFSRGQVFARGTYEGQLWAEAGAPTLGFLGFQGFVLHAGWQH